MRTFDKLALGAWLALAGAAAALSSGLLGWTTLEGARLCLFKLWLGVSCPGCGMGHALIHAFQGHWGESLSHHPLGLPFLAVWTFWIGWGLWNLRGGKRFSDSFPVTALLRRPIPASLVLAAVFGVFALRAAQLL